MSPGARVTLTMTAVRKTVTIVVVVRRSMSATTGAIHGTVPVRIVVLPLGPEPVGRLSPWQRRETTSVHDEHENLLKEGEAYGKFQQGPLTRQSDA
jgi:hypothetical protein